MYKLTKLFILTLLSFNAFSQENFNLELLSNVPVGEAGNDVWGYVDSLGTEYAIMGTRTTTKIWSLEDPANPIERASIPGPAGTWRDIKSFQDHIYVTSDQGDQGLLIVDMAQAPDSISFAYWKPTLEVGGSVEELEQCHNIYIDEAQGFAYLAGCNNSRGGVLIIDLNEDLDNPVHVGSADLNYAHDAYVKNDKLYASEIFIGEFNIYDISDKTNPILLGGAPTSRNFTHNAWLSDDENYLFTTDERGDAWVDAFDVSDPENIEFLDRFRPIETEGTGVVPHNTHYYDGFLVTSWYTDGVVITDATRPDNLVKVGSYDTELQIASGFDGIWGAFPYLPSGLVLGSDINNGLFVFQPVNNDGENGYQRASYLEGNVTDANTGATIQGVSVRILSDQMNADETNFSGDYKTGIVQNGLFDVEFMHPNYTPLTVSGVAIESGEVTILDVQLDNEILEGIVRDANTGEPLADAVVTIENVNEGVSLTTTTDDNGGWNIGLRANLTYNIYAGKWGYLHDSQTLEFQENLIVESDLEDGYQDDFFGDLGWETSGTASTGFWEVGTPNNIFSGGQVVQTSQDIPTDIGTSYYITGLDGSTGGEEDIDGGSAIVTSPAMDLLDADFVTLSFYTWFANAGGNQQPNDSMEIFITNGSERLSIYSENTTRSAWSNEIVIEVDNSQIEFNDNMRIQVFAVDTNPGHIVECGLDAFRAIPNIIESTFDLPIEELGLSVFPNPATDFINLTMENRLSGQNNVQITGTDGRLVYSSAVSDGTTQIDISQFSTGVYDLVIFGKDKRSEVKRFVKQ